MVTSLFEEYLLQEDSGTRKEELSLGYLHELKARDLDVWDEGTYQA